MKALRWFVIETETNWLRQYCTACESMEDARYAAGRIWEYAYSSRDRKHRRIEVAELWAVYDEDEEKWFPIMETDEGFDRDLMEGNWIGSYTPSFTFGPEE